MIMKPDCCIPVAIMNIPENLYKKFQYSNSLSVILSINS